jgi:hypothetical protein
MSVVKKSIFRMYPTITIRGSDVFLLMGTIYYLCAFIHVSQVLDKTDRGMAIIVIALTVNSILKFFEHVLKSRMAPDHGFYQFVMAMRKLSQFVSGLGMAYLSWLGLTWMYHHYL